MTWSTEQTIVAMASMRTGTRFASGSGPLEVVVRVVGVRGYDRVVVVERLFQPAEPRQQAGTVGDQDRPVEPVSVGREFPIEVFATLSDQAKGLQGVARVHLDKG
jgi:hypothetical protein